MQQHFQSDEENDYDHYSVEREGTNIYRIIVPN